MKRTPNALLPAGLIFSVLGLVLALTQGNAAYYGIVVMGAVMLAISRSRSVSSESATDGSEGSGNAR